MSIFDPFFNIIETGTGGDCLFYSLSYLLGGKKKNLQQATTVRRAIVNYMYRPENDDFCRLNDPLIMRRAGIDPREYTSIEDMISMESDDMYKQHEWGTEYELFKAAKLYRRPIIVYSSDPVYDVACSGASRLCPEVIEAIKNGFIFKGIQKYLEPPYDQIEHHLLCIYLPNHNTDAKPFIIYNSGNIHYQAMVNLDEQVDDEEDKEEDENKEVIKDKKPSSVCKKYMDALKENCIISFGKKKKSIKKKKKSIKRKRNNIL